MYPTTRRTPARADASIIRSASTTENAIGFSTNTCTPASAAATATGSWLPGVSTRTASSGSASRSRQSAWRRACGKSEPAQASVAGETSHSAATSNRSRSSPR